MLQIAAIVTGINLGVNNRGPGSEDCHCSLSGLKSLLFLIPPVLSTAELQVLSLSTEFIIAPSKTFRF